MGILIDLCVGLVAWAIGSNKLAIWTIHRHARLVFDQLVATLPASGFEVLEADVTEGHVRARGAWDGVKADQFFTMRVTWEANDRTRVNVKCDRDPHVKRRPARAQLEVLHQHLLATLGPPAPPPPGGPGATPPAP